MASECLGQVHKAKEELPSFNSKILSSIFCTKHTATTKYWDKQHILVHSEICGDMF